MLTLFLIVIVLYIIWKVKYSKYNYLSKHGIYSTATILNIIQTNSWSASSNSSEKLWIFEISISIHEPNEINRIVNLRQEFASSEQPEINEKVTVWIDPEDKNNVMIRNDGFKPNSKVTLLGIDIPYRKTSVKIKQ
ncbi:hypothetical protein [Mucilaginibacter segetis]|uniref:Uncharacterized protein n=1 Tax=Mucilaginibacter segetis TaxID=2793071 RepID=A0A934PXM3_9SPHI|nr:hypothetical protein [Mucilaginibacter segetis]MBK0380908.1 hypothetical protein [Mucilaginibacter segetis]